MNISATDLANELAELQKQFRAYTQTAEFAFAEINAPKAGGFVESYRRRSAEIQHELSRLRVRS